MSISIKEAMAKTVFQKDGKDHIHISPFANSQVGKYASMQWRKKFFFPMLGEFISPLAFMSWLATGDEMQRHAITPSRLPSMAKNEYLCHLKAGYLAKWYQLTAMHSSLIKSIKTIGSDPFELPWLEYKVHANGLKEFPQSQLNAEILKKLFKLNVTEGNKNGLKFINNSIIPNFELEETQNWINEVVCKNFNLSSSSSEVELEKKAEQPQ